MLKHHYRGVSSLATATAHAQAVRHVPPADADAGTALELVAEAAADDADARRALPHRAAPSVFADARARPQGRRDWVAVVPAAAVARARHRLLPRPPATQPVFASAEWPHTIAVYAAPEAERRTRDASRARGRARAFTRMGEWVDYGTRSTGRRHASDRSATTGSTPTSRTGCGRIRSRSCASATRACSATRGRRHERVTSSRPASRSVAGSSSASPPSRAFALDGRMMVMATQTGFAVGGRGEARLGVRDASHVALGVEYLADVGTNGFFRLGWGTVPQLADGGDRRDHEPAAHTQRDRRSPLLRHRPRGRARRAARHSRRLRGAQPVGRRLHRWRQRGGGVLDALPALLICIVCSSRTRRARRTGRARRRRQRYLRRPRRQDGVGAGSAARAAARDHRRRIRAPAHARAIGSRSARSTVAKSGASVSVAHADRRSREARARRRPRAPRRRASARSSIRGQSRSPRARARTAPVRARRTTPGASAADRRSRRPRARWRGRRRSASRPRSASAAGPQLLAADPQTPYRRADRERDRESCARRSERATSRWPRRRATNIDDRDPRIAQLARQLDGADTVDARSRRRSDRARGAWAAARSSRFSMRHAIARFGPRVSTCGPPGEPGLHAHRAPPRW